MTICTTTENGMQIWLNDGKLHREGGPAIEVVKGSTWETAWGVNEEWWWHGKRHRQGGPAVVKCGCKEWYLHGEFHREDGPSIEWPDGSKQWYWHGVRHRTDGPAIITAGKDEEWWLYGEKLTGSALLLYQKSFLCHIVVAGFLSLDIPPYVLLSILQFAYPFVYAFDERKLVNFLQGARISASTLLK